MSKTQTQQTDEALRAAEDAVAAQKKAAREENARLKKDLAEQEQRVGGVGRRTQKQRLIDTARIRAIFPERHFRYVRKDRVEEREDEGYTMVTEADAKKARTAVHRGDMVLMACNRAGFEASRKALEEENRRRLGASRGEFMAAVASEERAYRAQGVIADDQTLLVNDAD